jgi:hypothetical protein
MAANRANLAWGEGTVAHELTHVVVHQLTYTCLGSLPTWLDEGLATWVEGNPRQDAFDAALESDTLHSLQSLSGGFPANTARACLAYAQSYHVVRYLLEEYGRDEMSRLLQAFSEGATVDRALAQVYGLDLLGLENAWRISLGLSPREVAATPTATAVSTRGLYGLVTATVVPPTSTPRPPSTPTRTPTAAPKATSTPTATRTRRPTVTPSVAATRALPAPEQRTVSGLGWVGVLAVLCALALAGGGYLVVRRTQRSSGEHARAQPASVEDV